MATEKQIKIIDTQFDPEQRLVLWLVEDVGVGNPYTLAFPSDDVGPSIGFNKSIPDEAMLKFLEMLKGKTITNVQHATVKELPVDAFKLSEEDKAMGKLGLPVTNNTASADEIFNELDRYPYHEILTRLQQENDAD
ncbi:MAG: hypothetical protein HC888_00350 [Candidatus Competibacteraceae bacterium]|nr:hypothetical protein [Candidatus Competibacteraceae bacterium]